MTSNDFVNWLDGYLEASKYYANTEGEFAEFLTLVGEKIKEVKDGQKTISDTSAFVRPWTWAGAEGSPVKLLTTAAVPEATKPTKECVPFTTLTAAERQ